MAQTVSQLDEMITDFRQMLPTESATAQAIDQREPWQQIALNAVADGYIEFANDLGRFIEICVRRGV